MLRFVQMVSHSYKAQIHPAAPSDLTIGRITALWEVG